MIIVIISSRLIFFKLGEINEEDFLKTCPVQQCFLQDRDPDALLCQRDLLSQEVFIRQQPLVA